MQDSSHRSIEVIIKKSDDQSCYDGYVRVQRRAGGTLDVYVCRVHDDVQPVRREMASKSLGPDKAIELRDALIELYPLAKPAVKSTYEYDTIGGQPAVFETRQQHSTMRYKVAEFSTEADARLFIDAKNRATA